MKLVTYKIKNIKTHQIGVVKDDIVFNLNHLFGDISLVDLIQLENYHSRINGVIHDENISLSDSLILNFFLEENMTKEFLIKVSVN